MNIASATCRAASAGALLALIFSTSSIAATIRGPFDTPAAKVSAGAPAVDCPAAPEPTMSLSLYSPYKIGDLSFSQVDPGARARIDAETAPVRDFTSKVILQANRYAISKGENVAAGRCALQLLDTWAKAKALSDMKTHDAQFRRTLQLSGLALAYDQVKGLNGGDASHARISAWLAGQGADVRAHYDGLRPGDKVRNNNHLYWAALAEAAIAAATDDQRALRWSAEAYGRGVCSVKPNGALKLELDRAAKARHYHLYAAEPLVMTAEILARNGQRPYEICKGGLHRLVKFATTAISSPDAMEELSGSKQEPFFGADGGIQKSRMAWIELYDRRFPGRSAFSSRIATYRPYSSIEMGGAVSALLSR